MASKSRRKVGDGETEQGEYLKAKINDSKELVKALRTGIADIATKLGNQLKAMEDLGAKFDSFDRGDQEKNPTARKTFKALSQSIEKLGEQQAMQIGRLNTITANLVPFENRCKTAQDSLNEYTRQATNLRDKTKAAANEKQSKKAAMAEKELEGAQAQEEGAARDLAKVMQEFENERTQLLKVVLGDFIHMHIEYHAKSLERYTEMYRQHDGIIPDNIEDIVGLHKSRPTLDSV